MGETIAISITATISRNVFIIGRRDNQPSALRGKRDAVGSRCALWAETLVENKQVRGRRQHNAIDPDLFQLLSKQLTVFPFTLLRMSLARFHDAQASRSVGYDTALAEMRRGHKTSHWVWYVFPQLAGLGLSSTARAYALGNLAEALAYLRDPVLRMRYEEITNVVSNQLAGGRSLDDLMGSSIDALKLVSSLTFSVSPPKASPAKGPIFDALAQRCDSILQQTASQGYPQCAQTLARITG